MTAQQQPASFQQSADSTKRQIILATDVVETSVTIPDLTHVIDTGEHDRFTYFTACNAYVMCYQDASSATKKHKEAEE